MGLHTEGFVENLVECKICGAVWSVNHGVTEMVRDPQAKSFLSASSECVEADDYSLVA
jgi:hypothetical protein